MKLFDKEKNRITGLALFIVLMLIFILRILLKSP